MYRLLKSVWSGVRFRKMEVGVERDMGGYGRGECRLGSLGRDCEKG